MKALVTGGAGFIGSHLVEKLLKEGYHVTILDNFFTGRQENLSHISTPRLEIVEGSVEDAPKVHSLVSQSDVVFHLGGIVGVKNVMRYPLRTVQGTLRGMDAVLSAAAACQKPIFVASTSEVYGKHLDRLDPQGQKTLSEKDDLVLGSPYYHRWAYAHGKLLGEFLGLAYYKEQGLPVVIGRFFNTVGPRQSPNYGMVIPNFVRRALQNKPLPIYGDGTQKRTFLHVKDAVEAIYKLMQTPAAAGKIVNIGNPTEITILALAQQILHLTHSQSEIQFIPYLDAYGEGFEDMQRRTPNIRLLQQLIDFSPNYNLDQILQETIDYERKILLI
ncbi:MAG: NAD-dependent epimerase/dehydratase family protein [Bacteroidia bacterium]